MAGLAAVGFGVAGLASSPAEAAGVAAGTIIQNTATANYTTGGVSGSVHSNTVSLTVAELLDVTVASLDGAPVPAEGGGTAVLAYALTNKGNGSEAFAVAVDPAIPGNPFNGTIQTIAIDSNGNGVYDAGVDAVIVPGGTTPALAADAALKLFVLTTVPAGTGDSLTSQIRLTATAHTGNGTPGTTFAGLGDGGVDAVVGATSARSSALSGLITRLAAVTLSKAALISDPFGGATPLPGALVTYRLTAHVAGSGSADGVRVTDAIPPGTTYQTGTLKLDGTALTDAADSDPGSAGSAGIDVLLGTLAGGGSDHTITFIVKIN